ncbi:MAG: thiaminase II [Alphaproteobacteria bacterium]|nr:thiaminase II [Alphaproteobacteria bacterium]HCP01479.1 thiaminase II [Rhodospirillaceae bacterium]
MIYLNDFELFPHLRRISPSWQNYVAHPFVEGIRDGTLPDKAFRYYLGQDYLFLIHFARAYALAAYKADSLSDIRDAALGMSTIVDTEMALHVEYCRDWGLDEPAIESLTEASTTMAYTRYVLEKGHQGDLLDLYVALAPCVIGYGEIGARLAADTTARRNGNPYSSWIEMYAGNEYQMAARTHAQTLERLWLRRAAKGRLEDLSQVFEEATRLETEFWQAALDAV